MKKLIICTLCPNGCEITAEYTNKQDIELTGTLCDKGKAYSINECFDPRRTFTGNVNIEGCIRRRLPVRSTSPIPKDKMLECAEYLRKITIEAPVNTGDVIAENIFDTGVDIISAMSIRREM